MQADFATALLATSPVSYWDGSLGTFGTLLDVSGNSNDMFPSGSPTPSQTGADGVAATAVDIDGLSNPGNYYAGSYDPFFSSPGEWSIGAWVYATGIPDGSGILMDTIGFDNSSAFSLGAGLFGGGDIEVGGQYDSGSANLASGGSLGTFQWTFLVVTFDFTNGFILYANGSFIGGQPTYGFPNSEQPFIGYNDDGVSSVPYWPGLIDQPFITNFPLTDFTIATLDAAMRSAGGGLTITGAGAIASAQAIGSHTVTPGKVTLSPAGIATAEAIGTPALKLSVLPSGIVTAETVPSPIITPGSVQVAPAGIATAETIGAHTVSQLVAGISSAGAIATAEAIGTDTITTGPVTVSPTGIASAEAIGTPTITGGTPPANPPRQLPTLNVG